jgi:UDP:flavonoid glycosyltransferase YjiC (YdhE family)
MDKPLVLIAALNWGLGHASRCIPVVMAFQKNGFEPVICGNGDSFTILKNEFPNLRSYLLPSYSIRYPKNPRHFAMKMLCHLPRFFSAIRKDRNRLRQIVKEIKPSVIFSDNRYGFLPS